MAFYLDTYIAHRGLHDDKKPENTMAAFKAAIKHNYAIELDVHLSSDGHVVVFHDETLERLTGSNGK
ncbi:glycerophosphodiester phosphodiesterase family protein, partial [Halobacteriovorax sp. ZH3_bin.1]